MLLAVLSLLAVASIRAKNIGTLRALPDIGSVSPPRNQWYTLDEQRRANFGYAYPGQAASNIRDADGNMAGSWSYVDADGNLIRATYTAGREQGFLVSSTNEGRVAPNVLADLSKVGTTPKVGACNEAPSGLKTQKAVLNSKSSKESVVDPKYIVGLTKSRGNDDPKLYYHCAGSLISKTHVLTSARCVTEENSNKPVHPARFNVRLGITKQSHDNLEGSEQASNIYEIKIHPDYDHITDENDIAVLTLDGPVEMTPKVAPICLVPKCFNSDGADLIAMGWGYKKYDGELSEVLRYAFLTGMKNEQCKVQFKNEKLPSTAMCANGNGKGINCILFVLWVRKRVGCIEEARKPTVYTKVASFLPWIAEQTIPI
ncbi:hypothetical protein DAPPUDRAFT_236108 [Daphnia pulex]|uniref:Peptidase S1 domain-containing protein n=1 Tax=Daphnia pulex TaxID=6669 RepID=E9FZZ7_DAPPU|nr:hypothetical protein DAPPUDRAFT_236108 [Daphnia pulex]|eukprot:EFX87136.1 hypothetical protein DAPPUDRAFT_236108 [Daphnia pulex]